MRDHYEDLVFGGKLYPDCAVYSYDESDDVTIYDTFIGWREDVVRALALRCSKPNIPTHLSEPLFCRAMGFVRINKNLLPAKVSKAFDAYDVVRGKKQEVKTTSVFHDTTTFSPKDRCDELFWMDFFNRVEGNSNFSIYKLDKNALLNFNVNKNETFQEQQERGIRPRVNIRQEFITPLDVHPVCEGRISIADGKPKIIATQLLDLDSAEANLDFTDPKNLKIFSLGS